ncbi:MAG TPA: IPT/TIG domain-containing protein [Candidatus Hydrogenedentes bacterium]|nr:IPT/TIG domain-containing protein [Candidatus Hydrogenedentota bacterium]HPG65226.1 IPT/TIG domain-containing protein [Candidatus Hydrogenedentota bacterium]
MGTKTKLVLASLVSLMMVVAFAIGLFPSYTTPAARAAGASDVSMADVLGAILGPKELTAPTIVSPPANMVYKVPATATEPVWLRVEAETADPASTQNMGITIDGEFSIPGRWTEDGYGFGEIITEPPYALDVDLTELLNAGAWSHQPTHWIGAIANVAAVQDAAYVYHWEFDDALKSRVDIDVVAANQVLVDADNNGIPDDLMDVVIGLAPGEVWTGRNSQGALVIAANLDKGGAKDLYGLDGVTLAFDNVRIEAPSREMLGTGEGNAGLIPDGDDAFIIVCLSPSLDELLLDWMPDTPGLAAEIEGKQPTPPLEVAEDTFAQYVEVSIIFNRADDGRADDYDEIEELPAEFPVSVTMSGLLSRDGKVARFLSYPTVVSPTAPHTVTTSADHEWEDKNPTDIVLDGAMTSDLTFLSLLAPFGSILSIYDVIPRMGPVAGGNSVQIDLDFPWAQDAATPQEAAAMMNVYFGDTLAAFDGGQSMVIDGKFVHVLAPAGVANDTVDVKVEDAQYTYDSDVLPDAYTYVPVPTVGAVVPSIGPASGGTTITITGSGLTHASAVHFLYGGVDRLCTGLNVLGDTSLTVSTPAMNAASVDVVVVTPGGEATKPQGFTYTSQLLVSVDPAGAGTTDPAAGVAQGYPVGTVVPVLATPADGFALYGWQVNGAGAGISNPLEVTMGTTDTHVVACFVAETANMAVASVMPDSGTWDGGTPVKITGTFPVSTALTSVAAAEAAYTVYFGGDLVMAAFDSTVPEIVTANAMYVITPPHGAGPVPVRVADALDPTHFAQLDQAFTYVAMSIPEIDSVTPNVGPTAGGLVVRIRGSRLTAATGVLFSTATTDTPAPSFEIVSDTEMRVVTPAHEAGTVDVQVVGQYGTAVLTDGFTFTANLGTLFVTVEPAGTATTAPVPDTVHTYPVNTEVTIVATYDTLDYAVDYWEIDGEPAGASDQVVVTVVEGSTNVKVHMMPLYHLEEAVPNQGPVEGGNEVALLGFFPVAQTITSVEAAAAAYRVYFGPMDGVPADFDASVENIIAADKVYVIAPPSGPGVVDIFFVDALEPSQFMALEDGYTYIPAPPVIDDIVPDNGPRLGGTAVRIIGQSLLTTHAVYFGDEDPSRLAVGLVAISDTEVLCYTPPSPTYAKAGPVEPVAVTLYTTGGAAVSGYNYTDEPYFTLTIQKSPEEGGIIRPGQESRFSQGTTVIIKATANTGFIFDHWEGDVADPNASATTVVMDADKTITAVFLRQYTLSIEVLPPEGGYCSPSPGTYVRTEGDMVSLQFYAYEGWVFDHAELNGMNIGIPEDVPVFPIEEDMAITLVFSEFHVDQLVPPAGPLEGGTAIDIMGVFPVAEAFSSIEAIYASYAVYFSSPARTAKLPFNVGAPKIEADEVFTPTTIKVVAPAWSTTDTVNLTIADLVQPSRSITVPGAYTYAGTPTIDGITPNMGPTIGGTAVFITGQQLATAYAVYFGDNLAEIRGVEPLATGQDLLKLTSPPSPSVGEVTVRVLAGGGEVMTLFTYTKTFFTLTVQASPEEGGRVRPQGTYNYAQGDVVWVNAIANEGYLFDRWEGGVNSPSQAGTSVTMDGDKTITAFFMEGVRLTMAAEPPEGGTVSPSVGAHWYRNTDTVTLSATANTGWFFDHWEINGAAAGTDATLLNVPMNEEKDAVAYFVHFELFDVIPERGPMTGGTLLDVLGAIPVAQALNTIEEVYASYALYFYSSYGQRELGFSTVPPIVTGEHIYASSPGWDQAETVNLRVVDKVNPGRVATLLNAYTYLGMPEADAITPPVGPMLGGTFVTITGRHLASAYAVYFGEAKAAMPAIDLDVVSDTTLTCVTPQSDVEGSVPVTVCTEGGTDSLTFTYVKEHYDLTIEATPGGQTLPPVGTYYYAPDTIVGLWALPDDGFAFDRWEGDVAAPNSAATPITMDGDKTVKAIFGVARKLTIAVSPADSGTVAADPALDQYAEGKEVGLSATPKTGWRFDHWEGNVADVNAAVTTIVMDSDESVTAHFIKTYTLEVAVVGEGGVNVMAGVYDIGTVVDLVATPAAGWLFARWDGAVADPTSAATTVTMSANRVVTANFAKGYTLTMSVQPEGAGSVAANPDAAGGLYREGINVAVSATPHDGWALDHWLVNDVRLDPAPSIALVMNEDKNVVAVFVSSGVYAITPVSGWLFGGVVAQITGAGFSADSVVKFNTVEAEVVSATETELLVLVPAWRYAANEAEVSYTVTVTVDDQEVGPFTYYRNLFDGNVMATAFIYVPEADVDSTITVDVALGGVEAALLTLPVAGKSTTDVYGLVRASQTPEALDSDAITSVLGAETPISGIWDLAVHLYEAVDGLVTTGLAVNDMVYAEIDDWTYASSDPNPGRIEFPVGTATLGPDDLRGGLALWANRYTFDYGTNTMGTLPVPVVLYQSTLLANEVTPEVAAHTGADAVLTRIKARLYNVGAYSLRRNTQLPDSLIDAIGAGIKLDPGLHPEGTASGPLAGGTQVRLRSDIGGMGYSIDRVVFGSAEKAFSGANATIVEPRTSQFMIDVTSPEAAKAGWVDIAVYPKTVGGAAVEPWVIKNAFEYKAAKPECNIDVGLLATLGGLLVALLGLAAGGGNGGGGGPCFIATAAYGTPLAAEVDTLRALRDTYLLDNAVGAAFVDVYYHVSPTLAAVVAKSPVAAAVVRLALVPVIVGAKLVMAMPGVSLMLALCSLGLLVKRRIRHKA